MPHPTPANSADRQVVVLGGGYAGILAANRLGKNPGLSVTLVNPSPDFVERIRLHQWVADTGTVRHPLTSMVAAEVRVLVDRAERIDASAQRVYLSSGEFLGYDHLVYAVGSSGAPAPIPGAEHAFGVADWGSADRLRRHLTQIADDAPMVVIGGGLTGVETAAELAEQGREVTLLTDVLVPSFDVKGRRATRTQLQALGVEVREDVHVDEVTADMVCATDTATGEQLRLASAVTVVALGFGVPDLAARSGLQTDPLGRLRVDATLTSVDSPAIVGAGDAIIPGDSAFRMSCQTAMPLGAHAAATVLAHEDGREPSPFSMGFVGQNLSLGRSAATIQVTRFDDTPRSIAVRGRVAAVIKEAVCKGTVWFLQREATHPGAYRWVPRGRTAQAVSPTVQEHV